MRPKRACVGPLYDTSGFRNDFECEVVAGGKGSLQYRSEQITINVIIAPTVDCHRCVCMALMWEGVGIHAPPGECRFGGWWMIGAGDRLRFLLTCAYIKSIEAL